MKCKHILIPLDLMTSPCDALLAAREMAADQPISVTLLYVVNLNLGAPAQHVYEELCAEGRQALRRVARFFFGSEDCAEIVIRVGAPHKEILAEAKDESPDLVILSSPKHHSRWKELLGLGTARKVIDGASCPVMVVPRGGRIVRPRRQDAVLAEAPADVLLPAA
jgi:nucleotide-binding universal stress UspA family protein